MYLLDSRVAIQTTTNWKLIGRMLIVLERSRDVKLTTYLHLVPRLRMSGSVPPLPILHHDVHREKFALLYLHYLLAVFEKQILNVGLIR
jgi:hypothetical protein